MTYDIDIDSYIGYPISKEWVRQQLSHHAGGPVSVRINSYGGDVMTALDIRQQFIDHGDVTAYIYGMTASAATILALGAKRVKMSRYALMLIHRSSIGVDVWDMMNAEEIETTIAELRSRQADLKKIDCVIAAIYHLKASGHATAAAIADVMARGAWLTAEECLQLGLVDEITEDGQAEPVTDSVRHQFAACGLPVPHAGEAMPSSPLILAAANGDRSVPSPEKPLNTIDMEETITTTTPQLEQSQLSFQSSETSETTEATEAAAAADAAVLAARVSALETENAALREQIAALEKADGAETTTIETANSDSTVTAADMYHRIAAAL